MPSIQLPCTNSHHSSTIASALERRDSADTMLQAETRTPVEASTVIAAIFGFAAIVIIATSACIIFYHRRRHLPSSIPKTVPGWRRIAADADSQSELIDSQTKAAQQNLGTKQVPMLQPMEFLQGREGPKEFVGGRGKRRRSSSLPRLIVDGMGGIWPRRHSVWTLNSNFPASEDGEEQEGTSRRVSKRSHRSRPSSKATIGRKNGSASSTKPTTTVQMERIAKKPSTTFTGPLPSPSTPPSAFPTSRLLRNTSASTSGAPSSYKKSKLRLHHQGDSFLDDDIHEDELQTNYIGSVSSAAPSSILSPVDLAAFPVPPLPSLNIRNQVNNH